MKKISYLISALIFLLTIIVLPFKTLARENVNYWYIKDFVTDIQVNSDSSLLITEKITADCGNATGKHGIFRVLPTQFKTTSKTYNLPIELQSITDFQNNPLIYTTEKSFFNHTITWKIGDPNKTVQGVNYYQIKYKVLNAVRSGKDFDELYWNLNGNFWDMATDAYSANIHFPDQITKGNTQINLYTGTYGQKDVNLAGYVWENNILTVYSKRTLEVNEGITVSVTFPKNIVTAYQPSWFSKYGGYLFLILPILIFYFCFRLWKKYGDDPNINPTVVPEFEIPGDYPPMELGMISTNGAFRNHFISAGIVNLAVKGVLKIEEIPKKGIFESKNTKLSLLDANKSGLLESEKILIDKLFEGCKSVELSDLKNKFYTNIPAIVSAVKEPLVKKSLIQRTGYFLMIAFVFIALIFISLSVLAFVVSWQLGLSVILSGVIILIFAFLMPKRTLEGAQFNQKIKGFRLYMETAEKYRQRFNEKENIFEKFLPYAVLFGITNLWIEKMKTIYGEKYINNYHPAWYVGVGLASFNADSLNSAISDLSSNMASTLSSSPSSGSGVGGGGFSGGGGGGGGGGGW